MARLPRFYLPNQPLHVIQRGNNREPIFAADADYHFYLRCLQEAADTHSLTVHAYVLMTNHVHLLVTPATETSLSKTLQSIGRRYVQYFNFSYQRTGTLWEGRYKSTLIDSERYLLICMRYIEMNPVRAEMVAHPSDYPWSSYRANAQGNADVLLAPQELYQRLGRSDEERQSAYRQLFRAQVSKSDVDAIRDATNKGWVLGDSRFGEKVSALTDRRAMPMARGRPKKEVAD
ncbi:MAG: transposase [Gallionella sp.]